MQWASLKRKSGFTIVELLIVIVVIAILAAITIVAYTGIQNRAKASSAQSAAAQAAKRVAQVAVESGTETYPADQAAFDALKINSGSATYQYSADNTATPRTFCITATVGTTSYYINNTSATSPSLGGCPGHGQGGVDPITNYAINPNAVGSVAGFNQAGASPAANTASIASDRAHSGTTSFFRNITGSGQTGASAQVQSTARPRVNAGQTFSWSLWVYSTKAGSISPYCDGARVSDGAGVGLMSGNTTIPANTWTKMSATATASVDMYIGQCGGYALSVVAGDKVWFDEFMLNSGPAAAYADGDSTDWVWTGTPNASYSTGPRK